MLYFCLRYPEGQKQLSTCLIGTDMQGLCKRTVNVSRTSEQYASNCSAGRPEPIPLYLLVRCPWITWVILQSHTRSKAVQGCIGGCYIPVQSYPLPQVQTTQLINWLCYLWMWAVPPSVLSINCIVDLDLVSSYHTKCGELTFSFGGCRTLLDPRREGFSASPWSPTAAGFSQCADRRRSFSSLSAYQSHFNIG